VKEIKLGQIWSSKFGTKNKKSSAKVVSKLNSRCWQIDIDNGTDDRIITTDELLREYSFQSDK
jgi:hypothetical protein